MALTDKLRAAVFARDRGICAFSGLSLWILDYGTPFWHHDWPDHVKPVSRGGKDVLDNLVCASYFHNAKKRNNGADNSYLFRNGVPTEQYFWVYGELSAEHAETMLRHACLAEVDWYFNRALSSICIALHLEWNGTNAVRNVDYWLRAARKRLAIWRRLTGGDEPSTFLTRGLVQFPEAPDVRLMIEIGGVEDRRFLKVYEALSHHFRANADCLHEFTLADSAKDRLAILRRAKRNPCTTGPLLDRLRRSIERMDQVGTAH